MLEHRRYGLVRKLRARMLEHKQYMLEQRRDGLVRTLRARNLEHE